MKRKILCLLLMVLMLCGCERSAGVDVLQLCENFNRISIEAEFSEKSIIKSEHGDYIVFVKGKNSDAVIRFKCLENNEIQKCIITGKDKNKIIELSQKIVYVLGDNIPENFISEIKKSKQNVTVKNESCRYTGFEANDYFTIIWQRVI